MRAQKPWPQRRARDSAAQGGFPSKVPIAMYVVYGGQDWVMLQLLRGRTYAARRDLVYDSRSW